MRREQILVDAERLWGIHLPGSYALLPEGAGDDFRIAMDAQPALVTVANSGIPAMLSTWISPEILRLATSPMKAALIYDEVKQGDWLTDTAMFPVVENTVEVSTYGDFNNNGSTGVNFTFPQRQSYHYQTITEYGEREMERVGLAKLNYVSELNESAVIGLNKFQNKSYLFGIQGLQNYGMLNDPALLPSIQPGPKAFGSAAHGPWITAGVVTATPNEVFTDVQSMFTQLITQANGLVELDMDLPMELVMPTTSMMALTANNSFGTTTRGLLAAAFPNLEFVGCVEYALAAGNTVQLIVKEIEGKKTGLCAFTEKLRAHTIVPGLSSWSQKKSQGTWGWIGRLPWAIVTMLGV